MLADIQFRVYSHDVCATFPCIVCGSGHRQYNAAVTIYRGVEQLGDVCPACLRAGAKSAATRARRYAQDLRAEADFLTSLADEIEARQDFPKLADLKAAEREAHRRFLCEPGPDDD